MFYSVIVGLIIISDPQIIKNLWEGNFSSNRDRSVIRLAIKIIFKKVKHHDELHDSRKTNEIRMGNNHHCRSRSRLRWSYEDEIALELEQKSSLVKCVMGTRFVELQIAS